MTKSYCQKNQESLSKKAREKHLNLFEEEKDKMRQYAREWYRNLSDEENEKKRQYGRERYKELLEDEYEKKKIPECKNKGWLGIKHFFYLPLEWKYVLEYKENFQKSIINLFSVGFFGKNIRTFSGWVFRVGVGKCARLLLFPRLVLYIVILCILVVSFPIYGSACPGITLKASTSEQNGHVVYSSWLSYRQMINWLLLHFGERDQRFSQE